MYKQEENQGDQANRRRGRTRQRSRTKSISDVRGMFVENTADASQQTANKGDADAQAAISTGK